MIADKLHEILLELESFLYSLGPAIKDPQHWYITPRQHLAEIFAFVSLFSLIFAFAVRLHDDIHPEKKRHRDYINSGPWRLNFIEHMFRIAMTANLVITAYYKIVRGVHWYLLQPCHVTTFIYLMVLFSTDNYRRAYKIFNVSMHWGYFPFLAVIFPDTNDLDLFYEREMFWIHHWVLLFYPLYTIWINRFPLDRHNSYYFWMAMGFNGFMHYLVQTPAGFISGINVEYMLWPPPKLPAFMGNQHWRAWATVMFFMWTAVWGFIVPSIISSLKRLVGSKNV